MKRITLTLLSFISFVLVAAAQTAAIVNIDSIPENNFILDKGWKFHPGDNPDFSAVNYDDRTWKNINPYLYTPMIQASAREGIGWMRMRFHVEQSLGQTLLLQVYQRLAAEIYLNGKLVKKLGTINTRQNSGSGYLYHNPIELHLSNDTIQVIAVRFANEASLKNINGNIIREFFSASFTNIQNRVNDDIHHEVYHNVVSMCLIVLLLLSLLHLVFLFYNPDKKANLYLAGYAFFSSFFVFYILSLHVSQYVDTLVFITIAGFLLYLVSALFGIKALSILFNFKTGWYYYCLWALSAISGCLWIFDEKHQIAYYLSVLLLVATQLWLTAKAVYYKRRGAGIVAIGFLGALIGVFGVVYVNSFDNDRDTLYYLKLAITLGLSFLSPSFSISLFLFHEFALDSRLLKVKLIEVEQLSAANLAQEQEKQQILADQNLVLEQQVTERTAELNQSLTHLKQTQTQLIQSEKMASLGELTAGIAHEIQNPLNFVNNFSEVNKEMLEELKAESKKPKAERDEALEIELINDLIENEGKINHHGKRADSIVKGMVEHSRSHSGQKEPTDINAMADEFMRLSYHGLRAKDKSFNAELVTHFDPNLPKTEVVQQDIGRVLLNLFNNAFYATNQKAKTAGSAYKPEVTVSTAFEDSHVVIKVKDNGVGIPDAIKEKIMQPFFTTKPTGEGTGLGLSLTYDMVVKGHGGKIEVNTKEGEESEFIVILPVS